MTAVEQSAPVGAKRSLPLFEVEDLIRSRTLPEVEGRVYRVWWAELPKRWQVEVRYSATDGFRGHINHEETFELLERSSMGVLKAVSKFISTEELAICQLSPNPLLPSVSTSPYDTRTAELVRSAEARRENAEEILRHHHRAEAGREIRDLLAKLEEEITS